MNKFKKIAYFMQDRIKAVFISLIGNEEAKFNYIYKNKYWVIDKGGSSSGTGSSKEASKNLINDLNKFITQNNINTILDVPCGDWGWMSGIDMSDINYTGGDIVQDIITDNKDQFSTANISFKKINLSADKLMSCDLIIVRDLLVHLKNDDIFKCLQNIKNHNIKYIALTHYPETIKNKNPILGDRWRPLNMLIHPFNLNEPDFILSDNSNDGSIDEKRVMAIWEHSNFKESKERTKKATLSKSDTDYIIDKEILSLLSEKKYNNVLDLGAGSSPFKQYVSCSKYVTADVSNNKNNIDILIEPNSPIPIDDEEFDLIILTDVISHVTDYKLLLKECYRLLKKGGEIIISTPFIYRENETPNDMIRFTSFGLYYELDNNNFIDISIEKIGNAAYTIYCSLNECHIKNNEIIETSLFGKITRRIGNLLLLPLLNRSIFLKKPNSNSSYYHHLIARASK